MINVPVGFRFQPTDEDLIYYLVNRDNGEFLNVMKDWVKLYGSDGKEPQEMFKGSSANELYVYTLVKKKFGNGTYFDRKTATGTWKGQGKAKKIYDSENKSIGYVRTLNFFLDAGTQKDVSGSWIMHEYMLEEHPCDQESWALCRIKRGRGNESSSRKSAPALETDAQQEKKRRRTYASDDQYEAASWEEALNNLNNPANRKILSDLLADDKPSQHGDGDDVASFEKDVEYFTY